MVVAVCFFWLCGVFVAVFVGGVCVCGCVCVCVCCCVCVCVLSVCVCLVRVGEGCVFGGCVVRVCVGCLMRLVEWLTCVVRMTA